jgi:O-antigen ligase
LPRRWLLLGLVLTAAGVVLTLAKDIYVGLCAAVPLLLVIYRPVRLVPIMLAGLAGVVALLAAIVITPGQVDTALDLSRTVPRTEQERIRLDRDSIEGFLHGPYFWTGRGVGSGGRYTAHERGWPAHNAFILAAAELGVLGLTVFLLVYALAFARAIALLSMVKSGPYVPIVRSLLPVMVVVLAGAQFEATYLDEFVWTNFAIIEATWILVRRQATATAETAAIVGAGG